MSQSQEGWRAEGVSREWGWVPRAGAPAWAHVRPSLCLWGLPASPVRLQGPLLSEMR